MMVATLLEPDLAAVASAMRNFDPHADAFEVRWDAFTKRPDAPEIRKLTAKPLIATCRRPHDGGEWTGDEAERLAILEAAQQAGFEHVDLEGATQLPIPEDRVVRSHHDLKKPLSLDELLRMAETLGRNGAHAKIACRVNGLQDTLALLEATRHLHRNGRAASLMGLGDFPRALAHLFGSRFVYGGARAGAVGQPPLRDTYAVLEHWGRPDPAADLYVVLGKPVAHSLSPRLHNAAFRAQGLDAAYGALEAATHDELQLILARARPLGLAGLSVTAPLKEVAYELVDESTPEAARAKSLNAIKRDGDRFLGHNTDGLGAQRVLDRLGGKKARPRALLIGTGGAVRGFLAGVERVEFVVTGRNEKKLRAIENGYGVGTVPLDQARHYLDSYDVLVNATAVEEPITLEGFRGAVFDLHYGERPTPWQQQAQGAGLPFAGGRELLLEQAVPAYEFWTGRKAPRATMEEALEAAP